MAFLKVLLWIMLILLILIVLVVLVVACALNVKVGIGVGYEEDKAKLLVKYGLVKLNILPTNPDKKPSWIATRLKVLVKESGSKVGGKVKEKAVTTVEKKAVENDIKTAESLTAEATRLQEEETRLNAEMKKADEKLALAEKAEAEGNPLPLETVQVENKYSKLLETRDKIKALDIESAYINVRSFMDGFDYNSVVALVKLLGAESKVMGGKLGKRILIKEFKVKLNVAGSDAANTAIKYGEVGAVCFPALAKLVKTGRVKDYDLDITPDWHASKSSAECYFYVTFRPLRVLSPVGAFGIKAGKNSLKVFSENSAAIKDAKTKRVKEREEKLLRQTAAQANN